MKIQAIKNLAPLSEWVVGENSIIWLSEDVTKPTEEEINQEILRLQEEFNKKKRKIKVTIYLVNN